MNFSIRPYLPGHTHLTKAQYELQEALSLQLDFEYQVEHQEVVLNHAKRQASAGSKRIERLKAYIVMHTPVVVTPVPSQATPELSRRGRLAFSRQAKQENVAQLGAVRTS